MMLDSRIRNTLAISYSEEEARTLLADFTEEVTARVVSTDPQPKPPQDENGHPVAIEEAEEGEDE